VVLLGGSSNLRKLKHKQAKRDAKKLGCATMSPCSGGMTNHIKNRLFQRMPYDPFVSKKSISQMIKQRKAEVKKVEGGKEEVIFANEHRVYKVIIRRNKNRKKMVLISTWGCEA